MNDPMQMLNDFMRFKQSFRGDPKQEVYRLVSSGRISQNQLNQLQNQARLFQQFMQNMK